MNITSYGATLFQLTRFIAFNCHLVREADGFTLIDTCLSGSGAAIVAAAQRLGAPIRRILITHAHADHVGSLDELHALLPDAEIAISARDARFLTGDRHLDADEPQVPLRGGYPICTTTPTRLLRDGERIGSLEAIATPGHTPGHMAFFDHRDATLIAGDAFSTQGGISTASMFRPLFPITAFTTWDKPTAIRSAQRLYALAPKRLAVGHGRVMDNPLTAMQAAIAEAERKVLANAHAS